MSNRPICGADTPDPWMVSAYGKFYLTFTLGNRVEIWCSSQLENFNDCQKSVVWQPAPGSPWSADIWAPELHYLNGTWYIYTCSAPPQVGNPGHRTTLLKSNKTDPMDSSGWQFLGPLKGMPDHWSIDATIFSPNTYDLYCCFSGWPPGDNSDTQQDLFLVKMASPEEAIYSTLVCIAKADQPWERPDDGRRGVAEGPTWVDTQGFRGIVYSAHGSWTSEYKLALLAWTGGDPLRADSWVKRSRPLMHNERHRGGPYGPGHASFVPSPWHDGRIFCIYHATENWGEGWANRKARVMNLGPECFAQGAEPVCCSNGGQGGGGGAGSGQHAGPVITRQTIGDAIRVVDKFAGKAPAQVRAPLQGILGKAKKFF